LNIINSVTNANNVNTNKLTTMNKMNSLSNNNSSLNIINSINNFNSNNTLNCMKSFVFLQNNTEWNNNHVAAISKDQKDKKMKEWMKKESGNPPPQNSPNMKNIIIYKKD